MTKTLAKTILKQAVKVCSWILYGATLLAAYGGYMNPDWWTLPSIGVLFFPYLAIATLLVAGVWLATKRFITGGAGILVLMACGPTFLEAVPFRFGNKASNPQRTFKMITFNCLHMNDTQLPDNDYNRSLHFLIHSGADFICLQELYGFFTPEIPERYRAQVDSLVKIYPYYSADPWREIEFASKYPFKQLNIKLEDNMKFGNIAAYEMEIDGEPLTVINVHLPSYRLSKNERNVITNVKSKAGLKASIKELEGSIYSKMKKAFKQRAKVSKALAEYASTVKGNVIICGDFNDVPGSWSYRTFMKKGFEDAYAQTGFGHLITYNRHLMYFHIDQILYRGDLVPLNVRKKRMDASDHYPLLAEFEFL